MLDFLTGCSLKQKGTTMAIVTTDEGAVALYDSVNGKPIPWLPVFEGTDHAEDFLRWLQARAAKEDSDIPSPDPRKLTGFVLIDLHGEWWEERVDGETGRLKEAVGA
jgi:hypothetical protein